MTVVYFSSLVVWKRYGSICSKIHSAELLSVRLTVNRQALNVSLNSLTSLDGRWCSNSTCHFLLGERRTVDTGSENTMILMYCNNFKTSKQPRDYFKKSCLEIILSTLGCRLYP